MSARPKVRNYAPVTGAGADAMVFLIGSGASDAAAGKSGKAAPS